MVEATIKDVDCQDMGLIREEYLGEHSTACVAAGMGVMILSGL